MLKKEMAQKLNEQLNLEFYSANLYLQMSAWCSDKGFEGAAAFLKSILKKKCNIWNVCLNISVELALCLYWVRLRLHL